MRDLFITTVSLFSLVTLIDRTTLAAPKPNSAPSRKRATPEPKESFIYLRAKVISVLPDGILCTIWIRNSQRQFVRLDKTAALFGSFPDIVDGDDWEGKTYWAGRYQYTAVGGALKTVMALATTELGALKRIDPAAASVEESKIRPPFGLTWKQDAERLEQLLKGAKATITSRTKYGESEIWRVEGLVQTGLKETLFEMVQGKLSSISLIYEKSDWDDAKYRDFYQQVKNRISVRFHQPTREGSEQTSEFSRFGEGDRNILQESTWRRLETGIREMYSEDHNDPPSRTLKVQYATSLVNADSELPP